MSGTFPPTYPIELPPDVTVLNQGRFAWDFVLSWSNSYRSLEQAIVLQQPNFVPVGSFLTREGMLATVPGDIAYIVGYDTNATAGPVPVAVVARDAEVCDSGLAYGTLDRAAVNTHLREHLNIIVREAVLPNSMNATFHGQGQGWTP